MENRVMKQLLVLAVTACLCAPCFAVHLGVKKASEFINLPLRNPLDSAGLERRPDSAHLVTFADNGTSSSFITRSTTFPFSGISIDTTVPYAGDTNYYLVDQIQDIDGTAGNFQLTIVVTLWTAKLPTRTFGTVQVTTDSLNIFASINDSLESQDGWVAQSSILANVRDTVNGIMDSLQLQDNWVAQSSGVNVTQISGDATAADNWEAILDGTRAKLWLTQLNIVATSNDDAITAIGSGTGHGFEVAGGADGDGFNANGGGTSGYGMRVQAAAGNSVGAFISGFGSGAGVQIVGGATGDGLQVNGGSTSGAGLRALANGGNSHGIHATGLGSGSGIQVGAGATGIGFAINGGSTSGNAIDAVATAGYGARLKGGGASHGLFADGGASNGYGIWARGQGSGHGAVFESITTGSGLRAIGGATSGHGAHITGSGTGTNTAYGAFIQGGSTSHGAFIRSTKGDALALLSDSGNGLNAIGSRTGDGIRAEAVDSGSGAAFTGGDKGSSGLNPSGLYVRARFGDAMYIATTTSEASRHGIEVRGGTGTGNDAVRVVGGSTSGSGISISATDGDGVVSTGGTNGDGVDLQGAGTGVGLRATGVTSNITGNLSGSVGSVTGAVGSVTGNVGGNVVGSVASVTGNVGGNVGGNVTGSVGSVAAGGITNTSIAASAMTKLFGGKYGTVQASPSPTTSSFGGSSEFSQGDDFWNENIITFTTGSLTGQSARILDFTDANNVIALASVTTAAPASGDSFFVWGLLSESGSSTGADSGVVDRVMRRSIHDSTVSITQAADTIVNGRLSELLRLARVAPKTVVQSSPTPTATVFTGGSQYDTYTQVDAFVDQTLVFVSGNLKGQFGRITAYSGSTKQFTVATGSFTTTPAANDTFFVSAIPAAAGTAISGSDIAALADGVWDEATSGHTTAGTFGKDNQASAWPTPQQIADSIFMADTAANNDVANSYGRILASETYMQGSAAVEWTSGQRDSVLSAIRDAVLAGKVWNLSFSAAHTAGSMGDSLNNPSYTGNVYAISGDATAADNLEATLDGTGGVTWSMGRLVISTSDAAGALSIGNAGGDAVNIVATGGNGDGIAITKHGTGFGINAGTISAAITGNVTGNITGSVNSVTTPVGVNLDAVTGTLDNNELGNDLLTHEKLHFNAVQEIKDTIVNSTKFQDIYRLIAPKKGAVAASPSPTTTTFGSAAFTEASDYYDGQVLTFITGACARQSKRIADFSTTNDLFTVASPTVGTPAANDSFVVWGMISEAGGAASISDAVMAAIADSVWNVLFSELQTQRVGSIGDSLATPTYVQGAAGADTWTTAQRDSALNALRDVAIGDKVWIDALNRTLTAGIIDSATIARYVWNTPKANHNVNATFGDYLDRDISSLAGLAGSGAFTNTVVLLDTSTTPDSVINNAIVRVNNLAQNGTVYMAVTDNQGKARFNLDAGLWVRFTTFPGLAYDLDTINVAASTTDTMRVARNAGGKTTVYGYLDKPNGVMYAGAKYTIGLQSRYDSLLRVGDSLILADHEFQINGVANNDGYFWENLYPNTAFTNDSTWYTILVRDRATNVIRKRFNFRVPSSSTPLSLGSLIQWPIQ